MPFKDLPKDEVESKLDGVANEMKGFVEALPRYRGMAIGLESIISLIDKSLDLGRRTQEEYGRKKDLSLKGELSIAAIRHLLKEIENARQECTPNVPGTKTDTLQNEKTAKKEKSPPLVSTVTRRPSRGLRQDQWLQRLEELRRYKEEHGHCNVPGSYEENPQVGFWVANQRTHYGNRSPCMTKERIKLLRNLGFTWVIRSPSTSGPRVSWAERFEQLKQYKAQYGDCNVPRKYAENPQLGRWVENQRTHYRLLKEGKPSMMTNARIRSLNSKGFKWSLSKGRRKHL